MIADAIYDIERRANSSPGAWWCRSTAAARRRGQRSTGDAESLSPRTDPVYIKVLKRATRGDVALGDEWRVRPHSDLLAKLKAELEF